MKILVVYATRSGCTEDVARRIGNALRGLGADVKTMPYSAKPSPENWDAVIAGSGVRAGRWHGEAAGWVRKNASALKLKPFALFTVCMTMAQGQKKAPEVIAYTKPMLTELGLEPVGVGLFPGWHLPEKFGLLDRLILKMVKTPVGDFRDMAAVDSWTRDIAPRLGLEISMGPVSLDQADSADQAGSSLQVEM